MAGILSMLLVDFNAMVRTFQLPPGKEVPDFTLGLKLLSLIQPAVILTVMVLVGSMLAPKVVLTRPAAEAFAAGGKFFPELKPQVIPGIIGGAAGGMVVSFSALISKQLLDQEFVNRIAELGNMLPLATRLLYGGFTEELLLRWGFMTLLVWAAWRLFQKKNGLPKPAYVITAILVSSIVFGAGHLPLAFMILPEAPWIMIVFVIAANSIFGLMAGCLFWKKGLESAMIAHMTAHIVILAANYFGIY